MPLILVYGKSVPGSLGDVQFDENRVPFYPIEFKIIRNGSFEHYEGMIPVQ
jgi:hypothetical protein